MYHVRSFDPKTIRWWHGRSDEIDFQPAYQRRSNLWDKTRQQRLIDSIINGYDLPKFYVADFTLMHSAVLNPAGKSYAVIDGKQRFEAVFGFIEGEVSLAGDFVYKKNPSIDLSGLSYKELLERAPRIAYEFDDYVLSVISIATDEVGFINDLFVRLNSSQPLTGAEVRRAMDGPVTEAMRHLSSHRFVEQKVSFARNRGQADTLMLKLLYIELSGLNVDTGRSNLDYFAKNRVEATEDVIISTRDAVIRKLDRMCDVFEDNDRLLSRSGAISGFYVFLGLLPDRVLSEVRPFLQSFEADRSLLLKAVKAGIDPPESSYKLLESSNAAVREKIKAYNTVLRSIDEAQSLRMRVKILVETFVGEVTRRGVVPFDATI